MKYSCKGKKVDSESNQAFRPNFQSKEYIGESGAN